MIMDVVMVLTFVIFEREASQPMDGIRTTDQEEEIFLPTSST